MTKRRNITQLKIDAKIFSSCINLYDLQNKIALPKNDILMQAMHIKYHHFKIRKPKGGYRLIEAPNLDLKFLQSKLTKGNQ